jgi:hypothetical protein
MSSMFRTILFLAACTLALIPVGAHAQQSERFGDYLVHYNALSTDNLSADVARQYGITRSSRGGMLNIAVQKVAADDSTEAVKAKISGQAVNLTGQKSPIEFREIAGTDVTYIGLFEAKGPDTYTFTLSIRPDGVERAFTLRFNKNFVGE